MTTAGELPRYPKGWCRMIYLFLANGFEEIEGEIGLIRFSCILYQSDVPQSKTGATPFEFEYLDIKADDDIYVGISDLNDIRRRGTDKLSETIIKKTKRKPVDLEKFKSNRNRIIRTKKITVLVNDIMQFDVVTRNRNVDTVYFELTDSFEKNIDKIQLKKRE